VSDPSSSRSPKLKKSTLARTPMRWSVTAEQIVRQPPPSHSLLKTTRVGGKSQRITPAAWREAVSLSNRVDTNRLSVTRPEMRKVTMHPKNLKKLLLLACTPMTVRDSRLAGHASLANWQEFGLASHRFRNIHTNSGAVRFCSTFPRTLQTLPEVESQPPR